MNVSYTTGVDVLQHHLEGIRRRQFKVLLLFLGSAYDEAFLESVKSLAKDLDNLTGPHCLAIVFMPPPKENPFRQYALVDVFQGGGRVRDLAEWESFVDEMTRNTYQLARFLDIPLDYLPCLAFIDTEHPEDIATLRVHDKTLHDIYPQLRRLFSHWYDENKEALNAYDLAAIDRGYLTESSRIKPLIEENLRQNAIPAVEEAFNALLATNHDLDQEKVRRFLKRLRKKPRHTQPLVSFLQTHELTIQLDGSPTTSRNFNAAYWGLYSRALPNQDQFAPPVSRFPMDEVKSLSDDAELRRVGRRVSDGADTYKPTFDIVLAILRVFGLDA